MFKGIRLIPDDTTYKFMQISRFGYLVSGILCALSILLFVVNGLNMGVDFKGGTVITILLPAAPAGTPWPPTAAGASDARSI
jgi:preprotein translocase subunit SecF